MPTPNKPQSGFRIPLRAAVTLPMVLLVIATAIAVGFLTLRNAHDNVSQLISALQSELATYIAADLDNFLAMPHLVNRLNAQLIAESGYDFENLAAWRPAFFLHLMAFPSVTTCGFGTADGEFLAVGRRADGTYDTAVLDRSVNPNYLVQMMSSGGIPAETTQSVPDYDARSRSWYKTAIETGSPAWSPAYVWASQNNVGISAVLGVHDDTGELRSVQLAALSLERISAFLAELQIGESGYAFIMEPNGDLIGTSISEPLVQTAGDGSGLERVSARVAQSPIIRTATESLTSAFGTLDQVESHRQTTFRLDGKSYFLQAAPYVNEYSLEWLIVTVIPAEDFTAQISRDTKNAITLSLLAIVAALVIGAFTTGWVVNPVQNLNASAQALALGNWIPETKSSFITEVNELADSFAKMANQLRSSIDLLEQRVAQRTAALAQANDRLTAENDERRQIEAHLRKSEARFKTAQAVGRVGSWEYNVQTTVFWGSDEAKRIYGFDPAAPDFSVDDVESRIPERERVHQALMDLIEHDKPYNLVFEILPISEDESTIISSVAELVRDESGTPLRVIGVIQDITQRYRAQEEVRQLNEELEERVARRTTELKTAQDLLLRQERLAALGQLAGSIGHELRNPLGVISNAVHYLKMTQPDADDVTQEYLDIINTETMASSQIISDLLDLSRSRPARNAPKERLTIQGLVALALVSAPTPSNISTILELPDTLSEILGNEQQLRQVLTNLIGNSYQAMPDGGKLTIGAAADGEYLTLSITDSGYGISPENLERLFEPLFTTKLRGIGLGMTICKMLVENNNGSITVESQVDIGTTVHVKLPVAH